MSDNKFVVHTLFTYIVSTSAEVEKDLHMKIVSDHGASPAFLQYRGSDSFTGSAVSTAVFNVIDSAKIPADVGARVDIALKNGNVIKNKVVFVSAQAGISFLRKLLPKLSKAAQDAERKANGGHSVYALK